MIFQYCVWERGLKFPQNKESYLGGLKKNVSERCCSSSLAAQLTLIYDFRLTTVFCM